MNDLSTPTKLLPDFSPAPDKPDKFTYELSDFLFAKGNQLRFTLTWILEHRLLGKIGDSTAGCLFFMREGEYAWHHPKVRIGPNRLRQMHTVTPDYYKLVLDTLVRSKYTNFITDQRPDFMKPKLAHEIDPSLPEVLGPGFKELNGENETSQSN